MQSSDVPPKSPKVFAQSAGGTYTRTIPQTTADPAAASFTVGFPPQTFVDEGAGGTPPDGRDVNGILNFLSAWARWAGAGAPIVYDGTFQAAITGYPRGAIVASAVTFGLFWISTTENNVTNPDGGGAGWRKYMLSGCLLGLRVFAASTTYTPTDGTAAIEVTVVGGGGGGGGTSAMGGGQFGAGGGGGGGGSVTSFLTTGFAGAAIVIGASGAGGTGALGSNGGDTSFAGALLTASGGSGGYPASAASSGQVQLAGSGGGFSGGNRLQSFGHPGQPGIAFANSNLVSGAGGGSLYGAGGAPLASTSANGTAGGGPGGGGGGAVAQSGSGVRQGGAGAPGIAIIREYA